MKIERSLNIAVPIERDDGTIYVHSMPIGREIFERYYLPIARAYAAMIGNNLTAFSAPQVAFYLLRDAAKEMNRWDGDDGVERGLMAEIHRLTNVLMPSEKGWVTVPFAEVHAKKMIDDDDLAQVENLLVFFTLASVVPPRKERPTILAMTSVLWDAQTTSSNCTEFANSLSMSKETVSSGGKAPQSSIPY